MRNLPNPNFAYSGLTVLLDKPSRFDLKDKEHKLLIQGVAGDFFDSCLAAGGNSKIHRATVEVRTLQSANEPLLPNTKCILVLGEAALHRYISDISLFEQRGAPFMHRGIPCVATFTPQDSYDLRDYFSGEDDETEKEDSETAEGKTTHGRTQRKNWRFWMRQDIKKAVRLTTSFQPTPRPTYHIGPDLHDVVRLLSMTKGKDFYFDIETDRHLQMTCFGFSFDSKDIYVVPMLQTHCLPKTYFYTQTHLLFRALAIALRDNRVVIHNSMFDLFVLAWRYGIPIGHRVFDTMLAWNRCYIEVEKSLGHVISALTDLPYHKNEGIFEPHNKLQAQQLYEYNGKDVFALTQIKPEIEKLAEKLGATESVNLVNRSIVPYLTMTLEGTKLDEAKIAEIVDYHTRWNIQIKRILRYVTGQDFNPNSWQQVSAYLYDGLKIKKPEKDPTNEKTLLQLLLKHDVPAIHGILKYRGNQKRISKAGVKTKNKPPRYWLECPFGKQFEGPRITTSWGLGVTVTMRLGSRKLLKKWGDNEQNVEEELRKTHVPDKGKVLLQIDQAGAEALIVAYLCRPGQFRDIFLCNINPHSFLAMHAFKEQLEAELGFKLDHLVSLPVKLLPNEKQWPEVAKLAKETDKWPAERRYYFMAKQGNHSLNYDAKARMFRLNTLLKSDGAVNLSLEQAQTIIDVRSRLFPEIAEWQRNVVAGVYKTGILRNLFGHPRVITGHKNERAYKEWYAFIPQSTVGQITNYAITEFQERLMEEDKVLTAAGVDVLNNNHDSMLTQCFPEPKEVVGKEMQKHFNRELKNPQGETFFMKSEVKWSEKSWGEMETLKL